MECAVSIVDTSSDHSTSIARWTQIRRTSHLPAIPSTISLHQNIASITSGTGLNGSRLNAATITKTTTSRLVSPDSRGQPPRRVASRARPSINEHPACSKLSGVETGLLGCARKPTTVSVQLTSAQLKASANVPGAGLVRDDVRAGTCCAHLLLSEAESPRRRTEHGAPGPVMDYYTMYRGCLSNRHGPSLAAPIHVHRRRTDGLR